MLLELSSIALVVFAAFYFSIDWMIYHIIVMIIGEFLMAFFAVWTIHHDTEDNPEFARTQRGGWKNKITSVCFII